MKQKYTQPEFEMLEELTKNVLTASNDGVNETYGSLSDLLGGDGWLD